MTTTISRERAQDICQRLTAAGDDWQQVAAEISDIETYAVGTEAVRDLARLGPEVTAPGRPAGHSFRYHCTLYRTESGEWWPTGWSDASKARVYRPLGAYFDEDAGVYQSDDGESDA